MSGSARHFTIVPDIVRQGLIHWFDTNYDASAGTCEIGAGNTWVNLTGATFVHQSGSIRKSNLEYAGDGTDSVGPEFDGGDLHGFSFPGGEIVKQHFSMGSTGPVQDLEQFTIEVWAKLAGPTGVDQGLIAGRVVDYTDANKNDTLFSLRYAKDSALSSPGVTNIIKAGFGDGRSAVSGVPILQYESAAQVQRTGVWQQIVYTMDVTSQDCNDDVDPHDGKLYINAKKDIPTAKEHHGCAPLSAQGLDAVSADLKVGVSEYYNASTVTPNGDKNWHGEIGCVRIYDRVLSQEEVTTNYLGTARRFPGEEALFVPYYDQRLGAPDESEWGTLLQELTGTLGEWQTNNEWWTLEYDSFTNADVIQPFSIRRFNDGDGSSQNRSGEFRLSVNASNYATTVDFYNEYPNSFLRAIVGGVYYYLTIQEDNGSQTQFFWRPDISAANPQWTEENIEPKVGGNLNKGNYEWTGDTPFTLQLWSGLDQDGPGQEEP